MFYGEPDSLPHYCANHFFPVKKILPKDFRQIRPSGAFSLTSKRNPLF